MTLIAQPIAASTNAATDLLVNSVHRLAGVDRMVTGINMTGTESTTPIDVFASDVLVGRVYGGITTGGLNMYPVDSYVPAGVELRAILVSANTAVGVLYIQIDEVPDVDPGMGMAGLMEEAMM